MFRIITEGGHDPSDPVAVAPPAEDVPYVEVGGPDGVVTSIPVKPTVRVAPEPVPPPGPAVGPEARVLSVAFHRIPKAGLRLLPGGLSPDLVTFHHPDHPVSAEYRDVRDEIRRQFEEGGPRVLLFTAGAAAAGTTTVLLNLAVSLTREGSPRVLVADANFARPAAARRLGVADAPGLAEVIGQTVPLAWALQPTAVTNLQVLAAGGPADGTGAGVAADVPRLLAQLRQWFDWVLVDGGVWAEAVAPDGVGPVCDAVYLVTRQADIDRPEFAGLRAAVGAAGGLPRGYVTTRE